MQVGVGTRTVMGATADTPFFPFLTLTTNNRLKITCDQVWKDEVKFRRSFAIIDTYISDYLCQRGKKFSTHHASCI